MGVISNGSKRPRKALLIFGQPRATRKNTATLTSTMSRSLTAMFLAPSPVSATRLELDRLQACASIEPRYLE